MIQSILDSDFYKFSMGQAVMQLFPEAEAEYTFINRGNHKFPEGFSDDPRSALPVPGMLGLVGKIAVLEEYSLKRIVVSDSHESNDIEFKEYPPHCVRGTWGVQQTIGLMCDMPENLILKSTTDVWESGIGAWNQAIGDNLERTTPIVVVGVVTEICVKAFIDGAISRGYTDRLIVISDCIAGLNQFECDKCLVEWKAQGVTILTYAEFIIKYIM